MTVFAIKLAKDVQPNDRMFFDTPEEVAGVMAWALSNKAAGTEVVISVLAAAPGADGFPTKKQSATARWRAQCQEMIDYFDGQERGSSVPKEES